MQVTQERPEDNALTMEKCSATLGLAEFSLFSRVQTGDIKAVRARSGEMLIPSSEVERLVNGFANKPSDRDGTILPDSIRAKYVGFSGTQLFYRVPGLDVPLTENTISGYRAAFSAIFGQCQSLKDLNQQLRGDLRLFPACYA